MDFDPSKTSADRVGSPVGRQMNLVPAAQQLARQRLRWKQMPAGPASSKHERQAHGAVPVSRLRVSASIIPMPSPSASNEDPPYDRKGSVIPLVGIRCRLDAIF